MRLGFVDQHQTQTEANVIRMNDRPVAVHLFSHAAHSVFVSIRHVIREALETDLIITEEQTE